MVAQALPYWGPQAREVLDSSEDGVSHNIWAWKRCSAHSQRSPIGSAHSPNREGLKTRHMMTMPSHSRSMCIWDSVGTSHRTPTMYPHQARARYPEKIRYLLRM